LGSHRRWVVSCAVLQALSLVPLSLAALAGTGGAVLVFGAAAVYWGAGLGINPAWSTWVETLVPARIRAPYFSRRTRVTQFATLLGFVIGGVSLQAGAWSDTRLTAFAGIFLLAAVCRLASAACFAGQSERLPLTNPGRNVSLRDFCGRMRHSANGRLLFYLLAVQAAAQVAGPYFTPYMLGPMQLSYGAYVALIATSFAAKALALPACGRLAQRLGTHRLLWLGGLGIVPVSGLWIISNSFVFLLGVQVLAGVTWAAYELAMLLLFFETIRPQERTSVLTFYNLANSMATAAGSLLGGACLLYWGKNEPVYLVLFGLSSVGRALALVVLARVSRVPQPAPCPETNHAVRRGIRLDQPALHTGGTSRWPGPHGRFGAAD
jgi:predicted MFS family arabinose efflux permease